MNAPLVLSKKKLPGLYRPEDAKANDAKISAIIEYANRIKDWPLLERAVDAKMEEQAEFVGWWKETVTDKGGRPSKKPCADLGAVLSLTDAETHTGITHQQVSKWAKRLTEPEKYRTALYGVAYKKAMAAKNDSEVHVANNTGNNEWYTPPELIEAARECMGSIDMDPASSDAANGTVRAETFYTVDDDGRKQEWFGNVWMNPPYAQPLITEFCAALLQRLDSINSACVLVNNATETAWFSSLAEKCNAICFLKGRVKFLDMQGKPNGAPLQGQAILYFGSEPERFVKSFCRFGYIFGTPVCAA